MFNFLQVQSGREVGRASVFLQLQISDSDQYQQHS